MRTAKRITTACLTAIMIFQALAPSTEVFAQELDAVMEASVSAARAAGNTARSVQDAVATALDNADQATADDAATTPGADAGATEDGNGSTSTDGSQDSTTDGATNGDASTEGDASQDDTTADDSAADEDQTDDADADAAAQADVTYEYNSVEDLKNKAGITNITEENGKVTKIEFSSSADLIKISNTNPNVYQDAEITKSGFTGGSFDVTEKDGDLEFRGFGSPDAPFKGSLDLGNVALAVKRTLFNNIELSDANKNVAVTWKGTDARQPIVAAKVTGNNCELNANVTVATDSAELKSPLLGEVTGVMSLKATYSVQGGGALKKVAIEASSGNVGLLVNTLAESASLTIGELGGTSFAASTIKTTAEGCNAGGLIGECASGSTVAIGQAIDLSAFSVIGKAASGGLIGKATNLTLSIANDATIKPARSVGDASGACSGGVIGDVSFAKEFTVTSNMFDLGDGVTLGASQRAGALFGVADISNGDIVVQGGTYKSELTSGKDDSERRGSYGGLVGKVFATKEGEDGPLRALVVNKDPDKNKCSIEFDLASQLYYAGGVVGYVGDSARLEPQPVAVVLNGVTVACKGDASARIYDGKLGGAVGVVDTDDVLDVRDFTLTSENPIGKAQSNRAAGIAGSAWNAVVKFSGITDLSGASFAENSTTGQLVYENNNALIFAVGNGSDGKLADEGATGWTFKRSIKASKTDDIATYGEVIRLGSGFIKLDPDTHKLTLPASLAATNDTYVLNTIEDFAKLAITWQTNGYYSMVNGVSENNLNGLKSSTITVNGKIDLSGTGLTGFTQDRASDSQVFSGTLNGSGTINLAVGEPYGVRDKNDASNGNGKIYRHGRLGLFAAVNGATVSDVTIAGSMKFDNQSNVDAGALAGVKVGDTSLTSATFGTEIRYESTNKDNYVHVGGIFGSISGAGSLKIGNRESLSVINAKIDSNTQERGATCVGGAVGYVSGDCVPSASGKTVEVDGLTTSGSIAIKNGSVKTYAGGFIGKISQGKLDSGVLSSVKQVKITKLDFSKLSLSTAGANASNSAGLLGYSWAGAEVTLGDDSVNKDEGSYAITTSGSSVSSATATEFGGLVYAASGHWVINDYALNLSGVTLSAPKANKFGMLVCRAGSGVSSAVESLAGLYLENRAPWATAYKVNEDDDNAINTKASVFDEWVADGCKPGSAVDDCTVNGVVSLHTKEEKLHMTDADGAHNSYVNRTAYGSQPGHQANGLVRYYYNLDRAVASVKKNGAPEKWISKPEQLLVWSVSWYAPKAVRPFIWKETDGASLSWGQGRIGSANVIATLDMTGYSYYPVDLTGINAYVYNSTIKLRFSNIKKKESGNKQNSQPSQHMNMHAGLFNSYSGPNEVKILNVTLQGTIGSASGGTGALFSKFVKGQNGTASVTIDGLTLDGLSVDGATDSEYAPLLINQMKSKTNLKVSGHSKIKNNPAAGYVQGIAVKPDSYKVGEKAATSLFGNLGDKDAEMVTANFQDITVPSSIKDGIFTHASLLESFAYDGTKSGSSASYIFYSKKHKEEDSSFTYCEPTYGAEIDTKGNDSEYEGQQRWYNDNKGYMTDDNLVTDGSIRANEDSPQFASKYLPYVYKSKEGAGEHAHDTYHEIKINQRVSNLLTGCGTYGDPYSLTNAAEVVTVANYINGKESAADGWQITVIDDRENLCTRRNPDAGSKEHELIYEYKRSQGSWVCTTDPSKTLSNDTMHSYIQSAYYSIEPADGKTGSLDYIELDGNSFKGFGNKDNPFRGVIVGNLKKGLGKAMLKIVKKTRTISGLIPYSYGCVVKNLNVEYSGGSGATDSNTVSYGEGSDGIPASFFGGIFGCILGGDNIIDGVAVSSNGFTVAGGGTKPHLVPIGGYVGAITGGGVIFRHMSETSWRAGTKEKFKSAGEGGGNFQLYDNPYVGRVIDGYAFSEDCTVTVDNGDANYKINELNTGDTRCITTGDIKGRYRNKDNNKAAVTTTVNNAQGLLVLSAIISSGAAGGSANSATANNDYGTYAGSRAYLGGNNAEGTYQFGNQQYGKVRNASYEYVGNPESTNGDFVVSINDDTKSPGIQSEGNALDYTGDGSGVNSPYLVKKYATWQTGYICAAQVSGMDLQFVNTDEDIDYNMTPYGSGFTGLSGRYYSNACASSFGADRDRIVPLVACINGNGAKIKVGSKKDNTVYGVTEYADDDYKVAGVGALFSTVSFTSANVSDNTAGGMVKDLNFVDCNVELTIKDTNGTGQAGDNVGVGLLAGVTANNKGVSGIYRNVTMDGCKVAGAKNVGGLLGSSGYCSRSTVAGSTSMVNEKSRAASPVKLYDCTYTNMDVTGDLNVGGYVGMVSSPSGVWTSEAERVGEKTVGKSSTITATGTAPHVGGVFGFVKSSNISINTVIGKTDALPSSTAVVSGVNVLATTGSYNEKYMGAGGVVGRADGGVLSMSNVRIGAEDGTESVTIGDGTGKNTKIRNAGGLIGEVTSSGSPNTYWFEDCSVKNVNVAGTNQCSGGLIGYYYSNVNITCNNVAIENVAIKGSWSGGLLGAINKGSDVINVTNTKVSNTTFSGASNGGIAGDGRGQFHLVNVLMDSNTYKAGAKQGVLLGEVDTGNGNYSLSAAGVDVKPGNDKTTSDLPPMVYTTNTAAVNRKTYIAFGDYEDKFGDYEDKLPDAKGVTLYGNDAATGNVTTAVSPYVTTSPKSDLSVRTSDDDTTDRYLFGDGMNISLAETIKDEAGTPVANRYTYTNIGGIDDKSGTYQNTSSYSSSAGKFNKNNDTDDTKTDANPDVLVLSGNDSDTVKDYLNIVTNGGYSDALRLNADGSHVSATVDVFKLENGVFVKQTNVTDKALDVKGSGSSLSISANTNWDNGKGRFNLLTVTFTEAGQSYKVMVPIIVKRVFEINFTATYSEGSNFNSDDYGSKYDKHVLISGGETMTGYLTWTYNKAYKQPTEYGWNTHLASGGDMRPLNKRIVFGGERGALPAGTQLTLVDTAHNNKEYHYTVPQGETATSVALTDFEDSSKSHYTEQWLSETMGVAASVPEDGSGSWVKLTNEEKAGKNKAQLINIAGAKIGNDYYRVKTDADTEGPFYNLTVPKKKPDEQSKSESFYLVVRTPKNSANVNGYTGTSVTTTSVNTHLNYTLRNKDVTKDSHENTASTYSVATNFQHNLVDNKTLVDGKTSINQMSVRETTYPLNMDVSDTITFGEQEYTSSDALYYQLDSSLVNYEGGNAAGAHGYPTGTQGTYSFYVKVGNNFYAPYASTENGKTKWTWQETTAEDPCAVTGEWTANGTDMKLTLADANLGAIDLSGIREIAKENRSQFTITMKASLTMTEPACQAGIIASQKSGNDKCTKPNYRAYLSTHTDTLSTSSNSAYNDGGAGYYRADVGSSTIALVASKKSQLGINIDDLKSADGWIALLGTYDFSKLTGADAMISKATTVTYTLSLQRRNDKGTYDAVTDISKYITELRSDKLGTGSLSADGDSYEFSDSKADGKFKTRDDNSLAFKHAFSVKVNTDVEGKSQFYANYRLVLTAHMSGDDVNDVIDTPLNANNLDGYQNSDYVTYTLARINTEGIQHGSTTN